MFQLTLPAILINLLVCVVVVFITWLTKEPLAILGLLFMVPLPDFTIGPDEEQYTNAGNADLPGEYDGTSGGFTGTLK